MTRDYSTLGDKLLPKIIHAVSQAVITTKRGLMPWDHYVRVRASQDIIDQMGREVADHWGPLAQQILNQDDGTLSPDVRRFMQDSISGEHQLKAITGLTLGAAQSAISIFLSNELAPLVYRAVALNPNLDLDPATAAQAAATRINSVDDAANAARQQGFGRDQFETLHQLAFQWPGVADALDMLRRGFIDEALFTTILERNGVPPGVMEAWRHEANNALTLADAALAYLRSDISLSEAQAIARDNGYTDAQLNIFIGNTGEPPGLQQLLEGFRREFISQSELEHGIRQSRVRNEWIDLLVKLRYSPMSVADAVNAVVQNHISFADGAKFAQQNGLEPSAFPVLYETAGEPLSRTELEQLYNRNLIPESVVKQGLAESRLKNKYIDDAFKLHERLLEPRMLSSAVEAGALSHDEAVKLALEYGFSNRNAEILVNEGSARKLQTYGNRVSVAAESLYIDNIITQAELSDILKATRLEQTEVDLVLQSAEYRRQAKFATTAISAIRSRYVAHHISRTDASGFLDALGIDAGRRDELLSLWDIESTANVRTLTVAQVLKAVKLQLITPDDGLARLLNDGYNETDAALLLQGA